MKSCFKCRLVLPVDAFYEHPMMADGRLGKCKECTKRDARETRARNVDKYRAYDIARHKTPHRRQSAREAARLYRQRHPEKLAARNAVQAAVQSGRLIKGPCAVCGNEKSEAHHDDYSRKLDVVWLCLRHHRQREGRLISR